MKSIKTFLTIVVLLTIFVSNAQVSKQQSDNIVIETIMNDTTKVAYGLNGIITRMQSIFTADGIEINNPYDNAYAYYIDDMPSANWAHPCRYCFVNAVNGDYYISNQNFYPDNYEDFEALDTQQGHNRFQWPYTNYIIPQKATPNGKLYAVLIGGEPGTHPALKIWYDLSCVYTSLVNKYGFQERTATEPSHLIVMAHNDIMNFVQLNDMCVTNNLYDLNQSRGLYDTYDFLNANVIGYSKNGIHEIFNNLAGINNTTDQIPELTNEDQLFVFLCGHGDNTNGNSYFKIGGGNDRLYDYELTNWVRNIKCSQIVFLVDCCKSGGFVDDLMYDPYAVCKNRCVHTCTSDSHYGWVEQHITRRDREVESWQKVDELVYYWSAAALGYYPMLEIQGDSLLGPWHHYENTSIGEFPWQLFTSFDEGNGYSHEGFDTNPDNNNDGILSLDEIIVFANNLDSYSPEGYYNPIHNGLTILGPEYPQSAYESSFTKELITLNGYKGFIDNDAETGVGHSYLLDGNVKVVADASLIINEGCILDGNNHTIDNHGILTTASGLINATFRNTPLINKASQRFTLSNCVFDTCDIIKTLDADCSISNSTFNETRFEADTDNPPRDNYCVNLFENTFNNTFETNSIYIRKTPCCNVIGNYVTSGGNGIYINHLDGSCNNHIFSENIIQNCGKTGFVSYYSNSKLNKNKINTNHIGGIKTLNLSNLYVKGDSTASTMTAQKINNNLRFQIYASSDSYPVDFHFNGIYGSDTLLYYESSSSGNKIRSFDVTKNYWSNLTNNEISSHLFTNGNSSFSYLPTWAPHLPSDPPSPPGRMLSTGDSLVEKGDFSNAMAVYKTLVAAYPESSEAVAALLALFSVDIETNGDFDGLKNYYIGLMNNDYLSDVADKLVNRCDVVLNNFADAIEWYENKISDPNTLYSDRVFAEIDLGDLYIDMAAMGKKGIKGTMAEYIPVSKESHEKRTAYLLSLLPGKEENQILSDIHLVNNSSRLQMTCTPNPANDKITVLFVIDRESNVVFTLLDIFGNDVKHINLDKQCGGNHELSVELSDIPSGMYFCRMESDYGAKDIVKLLINH